MMHHSHSKPHRTGVQSKSLLLLCGWLGTTLGVGALSLSHRAYADELEDLGIPEVVPAAPATDTFIDPPEPAWEPAPAPEVPIAPAAPAPVALPAEPTTPAPVALPAKPPTTPAISPRIMPRVAEEPVVGQPRENAYIDSESYNLDAPPTTPKSVLTGSVSGCQANLNIDPVLAATLCGPPVVKTARQQPQQTQAYTATEYKTTAESRSYAYAPEAPAPQWKSNYSPSKTPTPWATDGPISLNPLTKTSASLGGLPSSPNPLKWLIPNQQRMIFPLPVPASVTSAFGWRTHPISGTSSFHAGTDLAAPTGTPVLAAFPGQVETSGFMGGYGLSVLLRHQQGQTATRYAHLSKIYVQPGQWVSQGTILGLVGSTGNSTGPHLHFETLEKKNNSLVTIDPGIQIKVSLAELIKGMQTAKVPPQSQS